MDNDVPSQEALLAVMREWQQLWMTRIREATTQSQQVSVQSVHQAYYYRGIAEGLRLALREVEQLLPTSPEAVGQGEATTIEAFAKVSLETAGVVLQRAGVRVAELQPHSDGSFSAIFSSLQLKPLEERIAKLTGAADVVILAQGRLPNSNKSYIDFAFRTAP